MPTDAERFEAMLGAVEEYVDGCPDSACTSCHHRRALLAIGRAVQVSIFAEDTSTMELVDANHVAGIQKLRTIALRVWENADDEA